MAKGKPSPKVTKGAKGRKNHGPKRHLHHSLEPKAMRLTISRTGVLSKYDDYESFCVSLQARGVRSNTQVLWTEFCHLGGNAAAQRQFFKDVKDIASRVNSADRKQKKAE